MTGTEKDIGGWFVDGKGVSESLSGLSIREETADTESFEDQERRRSKKTTTLPDSDPGGLPGGNEIGIYALGLQEIVDISSKTEALRPYIDPQPAKKWKTAVAEALPPDYVLVAEQQLIGLYILIYASETIAPTISHVSTTSVGTGLMGYMGNKGAVTARLVLGETTRMVFVNCHLTAGNEKGNLERRNWDASQILSRTKFDPMVEVGGPTQDFGEGIGDEDFAFWFGDLNYRLEDIPGEDVRRLLMLHTRDEYGKDADSKKKINRQLAKPESPTFKRNHEAANLVLDEDQFSTSTTLNSPSQPSIASSATLPEADLPDPFSDPASLQTTLSSLLKHDQLHSQMRKRLAFHDGWREGQIDFLPTYKYDAGSIGVFDSSEKQRGPSWCDRVLYRTRQDRLDYVEKVRQEELAKKRDDEIKLQGIVDAVQEDSILFDYDPDNDGAEDSNNATADNPQTVMTREGYEDRIRLDHYTSHQRVLSSDHKPLDAFFTLDYDTVDPELKAKIQQEVARELDKAENDGRPGVTIVVDQHRDSDSTKNDPLSPNFQGVNFDDVKYDHAKVRNITIANTGRVPATVGFVDRSVDAGQTGEVAPSWLKIAFDRPRDKTNHKTGAVDEYTLQPGDAASVELTLHVTDLDRVRRLSDGEESLEDVLVLRIYNGRDYFLPLRANWLQSAFGRSIDKLVRIPEGGVRRLQHQKPGGSSHGPGSTESHRQHIKDHFVGGHGSSSPGSAGDTDDAVKWSAPREIFRLTEAIEELIERSLAEWDMIRAANNDDSAPWERNAGWPFAGWVTETAKRGILELGVREALDTNTPFAELFPAESSSIEKLEALASTLLRFLHCLPDGIIPAATLWPHLDAVLTFIEKSKPPTPLDEQRILVLDTLSVSPPHSVSFTFITFMLSRVASEVAPVVLQPPMPLVRRGTATSFDEMGLDAVVAGKEQEGGGRGEEVRKSRERRREVEERFAEIFARAMVRVPGELGGKKRREADGRARKGVVEFLRGEEGG
ncbi:hypothetical protein MMC21_003308 [Puttea exsequens]|nr:hypothetical protein [Puttea exsequens]